MTRFNVNKSFAEAYESSEKVVLKKDGTIRYRVIALRDLITAKAKTNRPKDKLDIIELKRIHKL